MSKKQQEQMRTMKKLDPTKMKDWQIALAAY